MSVIEIQQEIVERLQTLEGIYYYEGIMPPLDAAMYPAVTSYLDTITEDTKSTGGNTDNSWNFRLSFYFPATDTEYASLAMTAAIVQILQLFRNDRTLGGTCENSWIRDMGSLYIPPEKQDGTYGLLMKPFTLSCMTEEVTA